MAERASNRTRARSDPAANTVRCPHCGATNRLRPSSEGVPRCARCKTTLPWIASATESSFDEELDASVPVVVDFWASWCAPCRMVEPVLQRLARDHAGQLKVVEVDIDKELGLAQKWQAMSIPLLVVMKDGTEVDRIVGAAPPAELERRLQQVIEPKVEPAGSTA